LTLVERIRAIERRFSQPVGSAVASAKSSTLLPTGWPEVDAVLGGGLPGGALHEWFGLAAPAGTPFDDEVSKTAWTPPLCVMAHLVRQAFAVRPGASWTVWVGQRCFPYPAVLVDPFQRDFRLLERSIFVGVSDPSARLWAVESALRSPAVGVVVADGSRFNMAATRRVQLLAKNTDTLALLVRPSWEHHELSAAQTRWLVRREPATNEGPASFVNPRWIVELLRCKGRQPDSARLVWALEWNRASRSVHLSTQVVRSTGDAAATTESGIRRTYRCPSA
jgi:hypothetical protein